LRPLEKNETYRLHAAAGFGHVKRPPLAGNNAPELPMRKSQMKWSGKMKLMILILIGVFGFLRASAQARQNQGIVVQEIPRHSVYEQIGLKAGDKILEVNGKPATSEAQALGMTEQRRAAGDIKMKIERAGVIQVLRYRVK
jgi:S1-C subfamily serine protease